MLDFANIKNSIQNMKVCVLGAGISGIAAAKLLATKDCSVILSDGKPKSLSADLLKYFKENNVHLELGTNSQYIYNCDFVVISPGIPPEAVEVQKFEALQIPIVSEIEMAYWFSGNRDIVAITGSNGKTTTTSLIYELLKNSNYKVWCGGNIGIPFSQLILDAEKDEENKHIFVLEVSSFQMERIKYFRPNVAVFLNLTKDHMDRYEDKMDLYFEAKFRIISNQTSDDYYVYNEDDQYLSNNIPRNCHGIPFSLSRVNKRGVFFQDNKFYLPGNREILSTSELHLKGRHNVYNILAAINVANIYNIPMKQISSTLSSFKSIEHRLEFVSKINGISYYNDSKATNVDAVLYALESFENPIILILGGKDKNSDFTQLRDFIQKYVKHVILIGEASGKIEKSLVNTTKMVKALDMTQAVHLASKLALDGEIVLLSPACASFDMFDNYGHRGRVFKKCVKDLNKNN